MVNVTALMDNWIKRITHYFITYAAQVRDQKESSLSLCWWSGAYQQQARCNSEAVHTKWERQLIMALAVECTKH